MSTPTPPDPARQAPLYGEYATPEEVAALTGVAAVPAPPPAPRPAAPTGARRFDRPVTVALLVFGVITLIQYAGLLVDFEAALERATAGTPMADVDFDATTTIAGRVLLGILLALLVAAALLSVVALRAGRVAFWIPLTAGLVGVLAIFVVYLVIIFATPGLFPTGT